jgi:hypothetical protein
MHGIPEPDQGWLVDQPVGHSQACDITSGAAGSLKLSAKRARFPPLTAAADPSLRDDAARDSAQEVTLPDSADRAGGCHT